MIIVLHTYVLFTKSGSPLQEVIGIIKSLQDWQQGKNKLSSATS
jgi:hypothetical protein